MKFSVLIPTLNRLSQLADAIASVRRQAGGDWEIVVSDNCSDEDISGYVASLGDARVRYVRTAERVPVTDNWNRALDHATGDYVVMLGDDDALLPGYFARQAELIERFGGPDFIFSSAYQFAWPGVLADHPGGYLLEARCPLFKGWGDAYVLPCDEGRRITEMSMRFELPLSYNMQYSLVRRGYIASLAEHGPFYQSPYPDYYATNVMFLTAERIVVNPEPMVVIGISPKSFGAYYFNGREAQGMAFLNNRGDQSATEARDPRRPFLPGSEHTNSWLLAMEQVERRFAARHGLRLDYRGYRRAQIWDVCRLHRSGQDPDGRLLAAVRREATAAERLWIFLNDTSRVSRRLKYYRARWFAKPERIEITYYKQAYRNILEVVDTHPIRCGKAGGAAGGGVTSGGAASGGSATGSA